MQYIGARGVGLPPPTALYPVTISDVPQFTASTNRVSLPPGGDFLLPPGKWNIVLGPYTAIQFLDPVTTMWTNIQTFGTNDYKQIDSDGSNYRILNASGFPVGAQIQNGGTGYTSAPVAAAGTGGSTWTCVIGGAVSQLNVSTASSGLNYAVPPIINIAAPPAGGVQATAVCTISGGTLATFTIINPGAGYASAPAVQVVPQASDLNENSTTVSVTDAVVTAQLSFVGVTTAVLLANEGNNPLGTPPVLTFSGGAGSNLAATAVMAYTITGLTTTTPGSGYATPVAFMAVGGTITSTAAATNNRAISTDMVYPRQMWCAASIGSGTGVSTVNSNIIDGGWFQQAPSVIPIGGFAAASNSSPNAAAVIAVTVGGANDTVLVSTT